LMGRADAHEGVMAFLERRPPQWQLRVSTDWPEWLDGDDGARAAPQSWDTARAAPQSGDA